MKLILKIFFAMGLLFLVGVVFFTTIVVLFSQLDESSASIPPSIEQIEEIFQDNREDFKLVMEYFSQSELSSSTTARHLQRGIIIIIRVYTHAGEDTPHVRVSDRETERAIRRLFRGGMDGVTRNGNEITFQLWRWLGQTSGVIYSINGETPNGHPIWTRTPAEFVPLEELGWYFYFRDPN